VPSAVLDYSPQACPPLPNTNSVSRYVGLSRSRYLTDLLRMELMRQAGNEPPLVGLLRVYKDYYPDVIVGDTSGRASVFMQPNQEWREHLHAIQEGNSRKEPHGLPSVERAFRVQRKSANAARMTQSSTIPEVHTSHAQEVSFHSLRDRNLPNQPVFCNFRRDRVCLRFYSET
jgi:hypothetical protein